MKLFHDNTGYIYYAVYNFDLVFVRDDWSEDVTGFA